MARHLVLVRHSLPEIDRLAPARRWRLSRVGVARCEPLADMLASFQPGIVMCSEEPKVRETAEAIAGRLSVQTEIVKGLHEHQRHGVPFMKRPEFEAAIASLFARHTELVLGEETAERAQPRFAGAIEKIIGDQKEGDIVVVVHGTVIALFVSGVAGVEPFALWKKLDLPSFLVLALPGFELLETVTTVV